MPKQRTEAGKKRSRANLKPFNKRTETEARLIAKKGGIQSGKVRRSKRAFAYWFKMAGELELNKKQAEELRQKINFDAKEEVISNDAGIVGLTTLEALEKDNIPARKLYIDTYFKLQEIQKSTEDEMIENENNESELLKALNTSAKEVWQ